MNEERLGYEELQKRLEQVEAILEALCRGEIDTLIGETEPLVVQLKSVMEERARLRVEAERLAKEWQATFDSTKDAIWVLDKEHRILRANRAAEQIFHRSREEMIGKRCCEIAHGSADAIPDCPFHRMRASLQRESFETEFDQRWYEITVDPILDAENHLAGAVHIASDITERKRAEEALRESEERFRRLAENARDLIYRYEITPHRGFTYVSPAALDITGYTPGEHYADPDLGFKIIHPEDRPLFEDMARGEIDWGMPLALRWIRKDGTVTWTEQRNVPIYDQAGSLVAIEGIARDITESKQAEEALREERDKFANIVAAAPGAICMFCQKSDGCPAYFPYASPAIEDIAGFTPEQLGQDASILRTMIHADDLGRVRQELTTAARTLAPWHSEFRYDHPKKGEVWIESHFIPSPAADGSIIWYGFALDVTQRKQMEKDQDILHAQLYQAQRLESVGRLAGGVAHDFNNMLSVILGYGENVLNQLHASDPLREDVKEIVEASKRSAALTRQLLAFSRKQTLQPETLDLNNVLENLSKMLHRLIGEDIVLEMALSENLAPVHADRGQMEQVIMNLAVNARDAMPMGGMLLIETANVELDAFYARNHPEVVPGSYIMLAMTDTGYGMDKETLSHIFEPFFTTKGVGKGTGLGLSTVYGIVKQSGGSIWVYSEVGKGTTFKIYLPRTKALPVVEKVDAGEVEQRSRGKHILVVEDEASLRGLLQRMLTTLGYRVTLAANGGEALLLVEEKKLTPDLLLTDVIMPEMSGAVLVERLRKTIPTLKALYMSGYTDNAIVHHGVLDQGTLFLQKPFTSRDLAEKVREALQ